MSKRGSIRFRMAEQRKEREITIEVLARQVPGAVLRKKVFFFFFHQETKAQKSSVMCPKLNSVDLPRRNVWINSSR